MKKKNVFEYGFLLVCVAVLCFGLFSCGSSARSDVTTAVESASTATATGGSIEAPVSVAGVVTNVAASISFPGMIWRIYNDLFTKVVLCIILVMWFTGNLHPSKGFKLFDK